MRRGGHFSNRRESGAVAIQVVLGLPLFLALIFFVVWIAVTFNSRTSLQTAMSKGLRLAFTRGNPEQVGKEMIAPIHDWKRSGAYDFSDPLAKLLYVNIPSAEIGDARAYYENVVLGAFAGPFTNGSLASFTDIPAMHLYALTYIYQAMAQGVGRNALKAPCDPNPAPGSDTDGAGCLSCVFENPRSTAQLYNYADC